MRFIRRFNWPLIAVEILKGIFAVTVMLSILFVIQIVIFFFDMGVP